MTKQKQIMVFRKQNYLLVIRSKGNTKQLLSLNREELKCLTGLFTWHCCLNYHLHGTAVCSLFIPCPVLLAGLPQYFSTPRRQVLTDCNGCPLKKLFLLKTPLIPQLPNLTMMGLGRGLLSSPCGRDLQTWPSGLGDRLRATVFSLTLKSMFNQGKGVREALVYDKKSFAIFLFIVVLASALLLL